MLESAESSVAEGEPTRSAPDGPEPGPTAAPSLMPRFLSLSLGALCLILFAKWLPNYLNWPWHTDHDHFSQLAESWNHGRLPYRDVFSGQFPGEIYLFWVIDALFGWGNSVAFYAVDAALVFVYGILVLLWSRRRFGLFLPGLVALTLFLSFYLEQCFEITAQREWHAIFLVSSGFFALELFPGRPGRIISGLCVGAALAIRPQVVLFVPGLLLILDQSARAPGEPLSRSLRAWLEWGIVIALTLFAAFLPLIVNGLIPDFVRCFSSIRYGAGLSLSPKARLKRIIETLTNRDSLIIVPLAMILLLNWRDVRNTAWREILGVLAILAGTILYGAASPNNHAYYQIPVVLWLGVVSAYFIEQLLVIRPARVLRSVLVLSILMLEGTASYRVLVGSNAAELFESYIDGKRTFTWNTSYNIKEGIDYLRRGVMPEKPPNGRREWTNRYPWGDYRAAIEYVRRETKPETPVVTLLLSCNTGINTAIPRLSPLPSDPMGTLSFPDLMSPDNDVLGSTPDCVVLCDPAFDEKTHPRFVVWFQTLREKFRREAAFGNIEIWRRIPEAGAKTPG